GGAAVKLAGLRVRGIELSQAMVAQLGKQPGASAIDVTIGDFATTELDETFTLVYRVRNTITNLTSQESQIECFRNAAVHLKPGGSVRDRELRPRAAASAFQSRQPLYIF